jgi:hypothetical protein
LDLLETWNKPVTRRLVIHQALYGAIGGAVVFALNAFAKPSFVQNWYVMLPALVLIGAGVGSIALIKGGQGEEC